ncbi:wiskott-Aldrich syndrome protein isoform X1 [Xiphophorus hellerii]|uniref:wiskott-Aldrich syndrome protein isoform X1 n=1 Tax=Xiphophorus hellerii TaxID=8084 RepID=UPI0013B46CF4|nr:wiskott-Aldrich syndrome protein-like isoform X1 [Xiphophorus hellerii]XP_032406421.1 wiskott-Aldrich syndrome protein-like isoform X1 [Xiphophorus hellerii]
MALSQIFQSHIMSDLLTIREKGILVRLLEPHCKLVKTTVAQILQANDSEGRSRSWHRVDCGVVCLIEDTSLQSFFLRLYCVQRAKLLWEQELYIPFKYAASRAYFHTFPGEADQVGLNFANESEAEEFQSAVQDVQEKMTAMIGKSKTEEKIFSRSNPPALEEKQEDHLYKKPVCFPPVPASPSLFSDLDPDMKKLLMEARLSEEDLKNKDVAEVVDCIINQFGGLKAVQKELKKKGTVSQTLPRSAGASISLALQKGPLPPVPSTQNSEQTTDSTTRTGDSQYTPPAAPGPGRLRRSASFKDVGSSAEPQKSDLILKALREVFNQKQMLRQTSREFQN